MAKTYSELVAEEEKYYIFKIGKNIASSLAGFVTGFVVGTVVWFTYFLPKLPAF